MTSTMTDMPMIPARPAWAANDIVQLGEYGTAFYRSSVIDAGGAQLSIEQFVDAEHSGDEPIKIEFREHESMDSGSIGVTLFDAGQARAVSAALAQLADKIDGDKQEPARFRSQIWHAVQVTASHLAAVTAGAAAFGIIV